MRPATGCKTYRQKLYEVLLRRIMFGDYPPGAELPSMGEVAGEYHVSYSLVRQVFKDLEGEGVIHCRNGQSAVVRPNLVEKLGLVLLATGGDVVYQEGPWGWLLAQGISRELLKRQIPLLNVNHIDSREQVWHYLSSGLISLYNRPHDTEYRKLALSTNRPFVFVQSFVQAPPDNVVHISYREGAEQAAYYLLSHGVKEVVNIMFPSGNFADRPDLDSPNHRFQPLFRIMLEHGTTPERIHFRVVPDIFSGMTPELEALVRRLKRPFGIVTFSDTVAHRVLKGCLEMGLRLKKDFFVIGSSGLPEAAHWEPALTSFHVSFDRIGEKAVDMLLEQRRSGVNRAAPFAVPTSLIIRDS